MHDFEWATCKNAFQVDGSLRDICVRNTTRDDCNRLLHFLTPWPTAFFVDGQPADILPPLTEIFEGRERSYLLRVDLGGPQARCHFFTDDEIELDIDPREVTSQVELDAVIRFLIGIGRAVGKTVASTEENRPDLIWLQYDARADRTTMLLPTRIGPL